MNIYFRRQIFVTLIVLSQAACGMQREDVLECGMNDGSKFVLRAKYDWEPLAKFIPHVAERLNQQPYVKEFIPKKGSPIPISGSRSHTRIDTYEEAAVLCASSGVFKGVPYSGAMAFLPPNADAFQDIDFPAKYYLRDVRKDNPENIQAELNRLNVYPRYGAITKVGHRIVREVGLVKLAKNCDATLFLSLSACPLLAVYRSDSSDEGKTWSTPIITTSAEIFKLGKPILEQSFVARPLSVNGKQVSALRREEERLKANEAKEKSADEARWKKQSQEYAQSLQSVIASGDLIQFEQRLNAGANINAPTGQDNRGPLLVALDKPESAPFALALIKRGANLNPKGLPQGVNVLMMAAGYSTPEVMKALLAKQKFDVNQPNPSGGTALSYAVGGGRLDNVRLLLELGADTQIKTSDGSLIDIARQQGHTEIVKLLEQRK